MSTPLQRFAWAVVRGVLGAILGAFFGALIVGLLLLPFPELQGRGRQMMVLFVFISGVSGLVASGAGAALASAKVGMACGALGAVTVSSLLLKHFPDEPEVITICAITVLVPTGIGALAGWIVRKWISTTTDNTAGP
jgi:uncharacterized membrane protein YjjB (DUF3815 family)